MGLPGLIEIAGPAVHQVDVHPAVVVVVEEGAAGSHGLGQVMIRRGGVVVDPANAAGFRRDLLEERARISCHGRPEEGQTGGSGGEELAAGLAAGAALHVSSGKPRRRVRYESGDP